MKTQLDMANIRRNIAQFPDRCYELNYEDLVTDPYKHIRETLEFCELDWYEDFEDVINSTNIHNLTNKWQKYLLEEEGNLLVEFFNRVNNHQAVSYSD